MRRATAGGAGGWAGQTLRCCLGAVIGVAIGSPAGALPEPAPSACLYLPRATAAEPSPEITTFANCADRREDGSVALRPAHLAALDFASVTLAVVQIDGEFYYVRRDGRAARVPTYDNWADDFVEGLVRTVATIDGVEKIGYLDSDLSVVIAPSFDWGFPFAEGRALVCRDCRMGAPDADGHRTVSGGLWGFIDRTGREVVPLAQSEEALLKRSERP